jgi:hypothetical protein
MKRKVVALLFGALLVLSTAGAALADGNNPDGSNVTGTAGYEGQPGNQAGGAGGAPPPPPPGLLGYEGQPGNQGG